MSDYMSTKKRRNAVFSETEDVSDYMSSHTKITYLKLTLDGD